MHMREPCVCAHILALCGEHRLVSDYMFIFPVYSPLFTDARKTCSPVFLLWPLQFFMPFWSLKANVWIVARKRKRATFFCKTVPRPATSCTRLSWTQASGLQPASPQRCLGIRETRVGVDGVCAGVGAWLGDVAICLSILSWKLQGGQQDKNKTRI